LTLKVDLMKKLLILLMWLLGLAVIAWFCGHGSGTPVAVPAVAPAVAPVATAPAVTTAAPAVPAAAAPEPAPKPSAAVVAAGMKIDAVLKTKIIEFRSGSATLTGVGRATLAEISPVLKENPALKFEVQGHTDSSGNEAGNRALSQARATAVKRMLSGQGVAADRITAKGYGSTQPVADNNIAEGRARNRRIAFSAEENK
jgi:OmpA-OmpF porin, OOP family